MDLTSSKDQSVCRDFCGRFGPQNKNVTNADRVKFMLSHPRIRAKLDEWIGSSIGDGYVKGNSSDQWKNEKNEDGSSGNINRTSKESSTTGKNAKYSEKQKEIGNTLFKQKKFYESIAAYNEAIRYAPYADDEECQSKEELLSLSFANRSAVYFELGESFYTRSLADLEHALKCGYPDRLKCKLLLRKANIYVKRKKWARAKSIIQQIQQSVNDDSCQYKLHPDGIAKLNELHYQIQQEIQEDDDLAISDGEEECLIAENPPVGFQENPMFANASINVALNFSSESTRFVTARKKLKKGNVIFYESPFASVLLPQFYDTHCHHCHSALDQFYFIPCKKCSQVRFCSGNCSRKAWQVYHKYECLSLDLLHSIGIAHLAARVIFCAGIEAMSDACSKEEHLRKPENIAVFAKESSPYDRVYSLLDHLEDMNPEDVFQYSLTAALLANWLVKCTTFFYLQEEPQEVKEFSETQIRVGGCILRHIGQLIANAHAITAVTDVLTDPNDQEITTTMSTTDESQVRIATAIFPAASMMNHSCGPNITFTFRYGKTLLVKVTKDVAEGQEIFNCYGPHWRRMGLEERQECLQSQYFFTCRCPHCIEEASTHGSYVDAFSSYRCGKCEGPVVLLRNDKDDNCMGRCKVCGNLMDLHDQIARITYTNRLLEQGEELFERGDVQEALYVFQKCHHEYSTVLYENHSSIGKLSDSIGRCYTVLGEFSKAAEMVKKSLSYVERRFGSESIEYAREVKKYLDLLSRTGKNVDLNELERLTKQYESVMSLSS